MYLFLIDPDPSPELTPKLFYDHLHKMIDLVVANNEAFVYRQTDLVLTDEPQHHPLAIWES